ncbi:MAG: DUF4924 family protein [Bacteroidales bacterium]|nr:DUF4924 family protein [Bacteroidales bacterium]
MVVAEEKRKNNIVEYILYLWQIEDLIRAYNFDMEKIDSELVSQYHADEELRTRIFNWYKNLVVMMQKEQIQKAGHLQFLINLTNELDQFHQLVIKKSINAEYQKLYSDIALDIDYIRQKSGLNHNDIEIVLNALYMILMLKMKNQELSDGTQVAIWKFGNFLNHLSMLFKEWETGELETEE